MKTRKATIRIDSDKVVQATVKGSPKFIQSYLADPYLKRRLREHYRRERVRSGNFRSLRVWLAG